MAKRFDWADDLAFQCKAIRLPAPVREFRPFADRKWRLDLCWPTRLLFVECDGGEFVRGIRGRHGGARDCEKWNRLTAEGWAGFRFVGSQIKSGAALQFIERLLTNGR